MTPCSRITNHASRITNFTLVAKICLSFSICFCYKLVGQQVVQLKYSNCERCFIPYWAGRIPLRETREILLQAENLAGGLANPALPDGRTRRALRQQPDQ